MESCSEYNSRESRKEACIHPCGRGIAVRLRRHGIWIRDPDRSVQSFRPIATAGGGGLPTFEILLHVVNPNLDPLELAGISYTISLDNLDLIKGVGNDLPVIEGYGEGSFTVTAGFSVLAGIQLFRSLMQKDTDSFDYSLKAKLDPGAYKRKIRISDSGSISLSNK